MGSHHPHHSEGIWERQQSFLPRLLTPARLCQAQQAGSTAVYTDRILPSVATLQHVTTSVPFMSLLTSTFPAASPGARTSVPLNTPQCSSSVLFSYLHPLGGHLLLRLPGRDVSSTYLFSKGSSDKPRHRSTKARPGEPVSSLDFVPEHWDVDICLRVPIEETKHDDQMQLGEERVHSSLWVVVQRIMTGARCRQDLGGRK